MIRKHDLEDIWRTLHPSEHKHTFASNVGTYSRINRFYTSRHSRANFTKCDITPFPLSDHKKVVLHFDLSQFKSGPGIWQLNSSVLRDSAYVSEMNNLIDELVDKRGSSDSPADWWEESKRAIVNFSKKFCAKRAKQRRSKKSKLLKQLRNADQKAQRIGKGQFSLLAKRISNEIWEIEISEAEGTKVRAKAKWCKEGEKVTKYFCSLEKKDKEIEIWLP